MVTSLEPHSILGKQQHHPSLKMTKLRLGEVNVLAGAKTRPFKKLVRRTIAWEPSGFWKSCDRKENYSDD